MTCTHCRHKIHWWSHYGFEVQADGSQQRWHSVCRRVYQHGYYRGINARSLELLTETQLRQLLADSERWPA